MKKYMKCGGTHYGNGGAAMSNNYECGGPVSKVIQGSSLRSAELGGTIGDAPIRKGKMMTGGSLRRKYNRGRGV
jgi:hypothetical protein